MTTPLLDWLDDPSNERGIRFALDGDGWDAWTYEQLASLVRRVASGLVAAGARRNDGVVVLARAGPSFVGSLFGAMAAGAIPTPLAPPLVFQDADAYLDHAAGVVGAVRPRLVVADDELLGIAEELVATAGAGRVVRFEEVAANGDEDARPRHAPADLALRQFTSGSSGRARGVRVPFAALEANVGAIRRWLGMTEEDATASWLPVHHDMGLIGCLVTPVVNRSDLWLLRPEHFVHRPLRYLRCFGADGARLTAMPSFGLGFIASRVDSAKLEGLDFAEWRAIIVGAERLDVRTLDRFQRLLEPFGLRRASLLPSYGLAEATLAVTGLPLEEEWTHRALVHEPPAGGDGRGGLDVVGCGRPLGDVAVTIVDGEGHALPEGVVGEIVVTGSSVAAGYVEAGPSPSLTAFTERGLRTGDAGFLLEGQLFVLGRLGDSLKIRGRTVFAEDLEAALVAEGVAPNRIVTLLGVSGEGVTAVALFEEAQADWLHTAESTLRRHVDGAAIVVLDAPRGAISRTTSHKPRRRELWEAFLGGRLPSRTVAVGKP